MGGRRADAPAAAARADRCAGRARRLLADPRFAARAGELAAWARDERRRGAAAPSWSSATRAAVGGDHLGERPLARAPWPRVEPERARADPLERGVVVAGGDHDPAAAAELADVVLDDRRGTRGRAPRRPRRAAGPRARSPGSRRGRAGPASPASRCGPGGRRRRRARALGDQVHRSRPRLGRARARRGPPSSSAFSRPVSSAWSPASVASSEPTRPRRPHVALVGGQHAGEHPQQRRLARPGRADERDARPGLESQVDAAQAPGRVADPAHVPRTRRHHAAAAVEVEAHPDVARAGPPPRLGRPRFCVGRDAHPTSFASAPARGGRRAARSRGSAPRRRAARAAPRRRATGRRAARHERTRTAR